MKISRFFILKSFRAIIVLALLIPFMTIPSEAQSDRSKAKRAKRSELAAENEVLRRKLDSLSAEMSQMRSICVKQNVEVEMPVVQEYKDDGFLRGEGDIEYMDSLLGIWYLHNSNALFEPCVYADSIKYESDVPDSVFISRLAAMNSFITLPYNQTVRNFIVLYAEKMRPRMASMLSLAEFYMPIFEAVLDKYEMPLELKYMAVIESALNPVAVSRAGAKGMWQFMYYAARNYGLAMDSFVDERFDYVKSADAAARYLKDAYKIYGDWNLAISSYNCGPGNVNKAIRRAGSKDFWAVYDFLPRETRGYVPAFVAAMYAFTYYKEHGIVPEPSGMPLQVDTFMINRKLHLRQVAEVTGAPIDVVKSLNPQYINDIIPGNPKSYVLRLPYEYTSTFIEKQDSVYTYKAKELLNPATLKEIESTGASGNRIAYKVKSGDYLGKIASRYRVSVAQIKKWNHLRNDNLRIGQILYIYGRSEPSSK